MEERPPSRALASVVYCGNFYAYDSIGPVADVLQRFFGISISLGFVFALVLWLTAGRRQHEAGRSRC